MSNKVKNAETKAVTDSQVTAAQVGVVQPANALKASVKQAQDKAVQALTAAELAKKKALEDEEAKLKEQSEESAQADSDESAEPASAQAVAEQSDEAVAQADETTVEDIEAVAKQLDDTAAGLDMAARDLGMMFAQAGGAAAAGTTAGVSTTAIVAGAVVVGAAVAASDSGSSSTGTAASSSSSTTANSGLTTFAAITPLVSEVSVNLAATQALSSALTQAAVSTVSGTASLTTLAFPSAFTYATPTTLAAGQFKTGVYTAATGSSVTNENQILSVTSAVLTEVGGTGQTIDGGAGTDIVRATLESSTTSALTLQNIEVVQVTSTSAATPPNISVSADNFGDVRELWNYRTAGTTRLINFADVESTATVIGINATGSDTSVTYAAAASGGSTVTAVLVDSLASSSLSLDSSAIVGGSGVTKLVISSNAGTGTGANVLDGVNVSSTTTTLDLIGNRALSLSAVDSEITTINAAGMVGNFTLDMGALAATNAAVIGGAATNVVGASLGTTAALGMTRVPTLNLALTGAATLNLADTTGLTTVNLSGTAGADATFKGLQTGVTFASKTTGTAVSIDDASFVYRDLSDFNLALSGTAATNFASVSLEGVRNANISSAVTSGASGVGAITVGTSTAAVNAVNLSNSGTVAFSASTITSAQAAPLVVALSTTSTGTLTTTAITSKADASVTLSATKGAVQSGAIQSTVEDVVVVANAVSANATVAGAITAEGSVGLTLTSTAGAAANVASVTGTVTAKTGDIGAVLTAGSSSGSQLAASATTGALVASEGSIGLSINSGGGTITAATATASGGSQVTVGTISAEEVVNVRIRNAEGGAVTIASTDVAADAPLTTIDSNSGSVGISILNESSSARRGTVTVARDTSNTVNGLSNHLIEASENVILEATNGANGLLNVGNISALDGIALVNITSNELGLVRMGTVSASDDVTIAFTAGSADGLVTPTTQHSIGYRAGAGTADLSTSQSGNVLVSISLSDKADVLLGNLAATLGNVTIGDSGDLGKNAVGNSGVVRMDLGANSTLTVGTIGATGVSDTGGTVTFGSAKNTIDLGASSTFATGAVTSDDNLEIRHFTLANGAHLNIGGAQSNAGTVLIAPTAGTIGSRLTTGTVQGYSDVSVAFTGNTNSIVNFAGVNSQFGNVDVNLTVGQTSATGTGAISNSADITALGQNSTATVLVSAGDYASIDLKAIRATRDTVLEITTGVGTTGARDNDVESLTSDLGNVVLKATVNSSIAASSRLLFADANQAELVATQGTVTVDPTTTVGAFGRLGLGAVSATGGSGAVTITGITLQESAQLDTTTIDALGNINVSAALGVNAQLSLGGAVTSTKGSVAIAATSASAGADVSITSVSALENIAVSAALGDNGQLTSGALASTDGNITLVSDSGKAGTSVSVTGNIGAGATDGVVNITASAGSGGALRIAADATVANLAITAGDDITIKATVASGTTNAVSEGVITSTVGDVAITANLLALDGNASSLTFGGATANLGSVSISGASGVGARGTLALGALTANGAGADGKGSSVAVGSVDNAIDIASRGSLTTGALSAHTNVSLYTTLAGGTAENARTQVTVGGATNAANGSVTFSALAGTLQNVAFDSSAGAVTAAQNVNVTFTGGTGSLFTLGAANTTTATAGDITISATVGDSLTANDSRIISGSLTATGSKGDITLTLAAGRESVVDVAGNAAEAIAGGSSVTINASTGIGTANLIGAGSGGITTVSGNVSLNLNVSSAAGADASSLTVGAITANQGDVTVLSRTLTTPTAANTAGIPIYSDFLGTGGTLAFTSITANGLSGDGRDINFGIRNSASNYNRLVLGDDSELKATALTAENDIGVYTIMGAGSKVHVTSDVIANNGSVRVIAASAEAAPALGDGNARTRLAFGRSTDGATAANIRAEDNIEIGFVGGFDSDVYIGNVRTLEGNVILNLITENSTANNDAVRVGKVEATGDLAVGLGTVTIKAHGGTGSALSIAEGTSIISDQTVNLDITVGEGIAAGHQSDVGTTGGITSNDGDVVVKATVISANSSTTHTAASTLNFGQIAVYDGNISISGDSLVEPQGHLVFGNGTLGLTAGRVSTAGVGNIDIGSSSNRVEVRFGGVNDATSTTDRTSLLHVNGTLIADGSVRSYVELGDGAQFKMGNTTGLGGITVDVLSRNNLVADLVGATVGGNVADLNTAAIGRIVVGTTTALGQTVDLKFVSTASTTASPLMQVGNISAGTVNLTYQGALTSVLSQGIASTSDGGLGTITYTTALNAYLSGSANVVFEDADISGTGARLFDALTLTGNLTAFGGTGNDTFKVGSAGSNNLTGNGGNDSFLVSGGSTTIVAGTGNDQFQVTGGAVSITGGNGSDVYRVTGGTASIAGGTGSDDISVSGSASSTTLVGGDATNSFVVSSGNTTITGGANIDLITVSASGTHSLTGGDGANTFRISGGSSTITGGGDTDDISVSGSAVSTTISAASGRNTVTVSAGNTTITGGGDIDIITVSSSGTHSVSGASGANTISVTAGAVTIAGGSDIDTISVSGSASTSSITGSSGANTINVSSGATTISGGADSDHLTVSSVGSHSVTGGSGANTFRISGGVVTLTGGANTDDISVSGSVTSSSIVGGAGTNTIVVTAGSATVTGGADADAVTISSVGTHSVDGGNGANTVSVSAGTVSVTGGTGSDIVSISGSVTSSTITTSSATNTVTVSAGATTITGGGEADIITVSSVGTNSHSVIGGDGANTIIVSGGSVTVTGGADADTITINSAVVSSLVTTGTGTNTVTISGGATTITGSDGSDIITVNGSATSSTIALGGSSANTVTVTAGSSSITGGNAIDVISITAASGTGHTVDGGSSGADTITISGAGAATITGGVGVDTFILSASTTTVTDLGNGNDVLKVTGGSFSATLTGNFTAGANSESTVLAANAVITSGTASAAVDLSAAVATTAGFGFTINLVNAGTATGGAGNDRLVASNGGQLVGGDGLDTFVVNNGVTTITDLGTNTTSGTAGSETLDINGGSLTASVTGAYVATALTENSQSAGSVVLNITTGTAVDLGLVTLGNGFTVNGDADAETIIGSYAADVIAAGNGNNSIVGGGGADAITAGTGNDTILGGIGNDTITSGTGTDVIRFGGGTTGAVGSVARVSSLGLDTVNDFVVVDDTLQFLATDFGGTAGAVSDNQIVVVATTTTTIATDSTQNLGAGNFDVTAAGFVVVGTNGAAANVGVYWFDGSLTGTPTQTVAGLITSGDMVHIANLTNLSAALTNADFVIA